MLHLYDYIFSLPFSFLLGLFNPDRIPSTSLGRSTEGFSFHIDSNPLKRVSCEFLGKLIYKELLLLFTKN